MQRIGIVAIDVRQFQPVKKGKDAVIRRVDVVDGKEPIDGVVELGLANSSRYPCNLLGTDVAAVADDSRKERSVGGSAAVVLDLQRSLRRKCKF